MPETILPLITQGVCQHFRSQDKLITFWPLSLLGCSSTGIVISVSFVYWCIPRYTLGTMPGTYWYSINICKINEYVCELGEIPKGSHWKWYIALHPDGYDPYKKKKKVTDRKKNRIA